MLLQLKFRKTQFELNGEVWSLDRGGGHPKYELHREDDMQVRLVITKTTLPVINSAIEQRSCTS